MHTHVVETKHVQKDHVVDGIMVMVVVQVNVDRDVLLLQKHQVVVDVLQDGVMPVVRICILMVVVELNVQSNRVNVSTVHGKHQQKHVRKHVVDIKHVQKVHVADGHVDHNGHHGEREAQDVDRNLENYISNKRNRNLFLFLLNNSLLFVKQRFTKEPI